LAAGFGHLECDAHRSFVVTLRSHVALRSGTNSDPTETGPVAPGAHGYRWTVAPHVADSGSGMKERIARYFPPGSFGRAVATLAGGTAIAQIVAIAASPIITRLYVPAEFGLLAVYVAVVIILLPLATLSYENAIPLPGDDLVAANLVAVVCTLTVIMGGLIAAVVGIVPDRAAALLRNPSIRSYLWLIPLGLIGAGLFQVMTYWTIRDGYFKGLAQARLTQAVGMASVQVGAGLAGLGAVGLMLGDIVGRSGGSLRLLRWSLRTHRPAFQAISLAGMKAAATRYRRFPVFQSWGSLLNTMAGQLPVVLFSGFYSLRVAGWFALSTRVLQLPMMLIGSAVAHVYLNEAALLARTDAILLASRFRAMVFRLFAVGLVPSLLLGTVAQPLFAFVFGSEWRPAGLYGQIMAPMLLAQFVISPLSVTLNVIEKQSWQSAWDAGRALLVIGSLVFVSSNGASPVTTVVVYSVASAVAMIALLVLSWVGVRRFESSWRAPTG
jgi:O-antigen/teichoic acid export membrane protein